MNIVHIAPSAPYNDYWGYQDNLLPKYHKKMGHNVTMITTTQMHQNGKLVETDVSDYELNDGVRVIRLKKKNYGNRILTSLNSRLEVYEHLKQIHPDFIFFHGLVSTSIFDVVRYKKQDNPSCVIVQDNHQDYNIGVTCKTLKQRLVRMFFRCIHRKTSKYISKVYGVTPWRKRYAEDYFKVSSSITDVLIMGADDEKVDLQNRELIRQRIREQYSVAENEFLIVTGGKINLKKRIHLLMDACRNKKGVKLLVFGQVLDDVKDEFNRILRNSDNIVYLGWIQSDEVYRYFFAADLVAFPGQHSVLWEQACASKVPCLFEKWEGMDHVNNGGNSCFIENVSKETLENAIDELMFSDLFFQMKKIAESEKTDIYLYSKIAEKSLSCSE